MRPVREASLARPPGTGGILGSRRAPGELCLKLTELEGIRGKIEGIPSDLKLTDLGYKIPT